MHDANLNDGKQAIKLLEEMFFWFFTIEMIWADGAYRGDLVQWLMLMYQCKLDITLNLNDKHFKVLPKRWVVERTFSWLGWYRRLNMDYERYSRTAETMVYIAMIRVMLKRIR